MLAALNPTDGSKNFPSLQSSLVFPCYHNRFIKCFKDPYLLNFHYPFSQGTAT